MQPTEAVDEAGAEMSVEAELPPVAVAEPTALVEVLMALVEQEREEHRRQSVIIQQLRDEMTRLMREPGKRKSKRNAKRSRR